jgi:hypothetical protein
VTYTVAQYLAADSAPQQFSFINGHVSRRDNLSDASDATGILGNFIDNVDDWYVLPPVNTPSDEPVESVRLLIRGLTSIAVFSDQTQFVEIWDAAGAVRLAAAYIPFVDVLADSVLDIAIPATLPDDLAGARIHIHVGMDGGIIPT